MARICLHLQSYIDKNKYLILYVLIVPIFFCQYRTEDLDKSEPSPSSTKKPGFFSSLLFGSSWQIQSYEKYSRTCASKWGPPNLVYVATFKEFSSKKSNVFLLKVGIISDGNFNFVLSWKIYETNHCPSTFQHKFSIHWIVEIL